MAERAVGPFLLGFALLAPVVDGAVGVMAASASYIAAPAAVRIALPQANPGYYLTAAIDITFPFNLVVGIPLVYAMATW